MITEQQDLKSIEVLVQVNAINVLWEYKIIKDNQVISKTNCRCSYSANQKEQFKIDLGELSDKFIGLIEWDKVQ